jgi:hypothetical protein
MKHLDFEKRTLKNFDFFDDWKQSSQNFQKCWHSAASFINSSFFAFASDLHGLSQIRVPYYYGYGLPSLLAVNSLCICFQLLSFPLNYLYFFSGQLIRS